MVTAHEQTGVVCQELISGAELSCSTACDALVLTTVSRGTFKFAGTPTHQDSCICVLLNRDPVRDVFKLEAPKA